MAGDLNQKLFEQFCHLVYEKSGITLKKGKEALVRARIGKRLRKLGMDDYEAYYNLVKNDKSGKELTELLDAISTNVTHFFRENEHFNLMHELVDKWVANGQKRFRFWSAACSSGEEPYSMAMTFLDTIKGHSGIDGKILATDISTSILRKCQAAQYTEDKFRTVSDSFRKQYFKCIDDGPPPLYQALPQLRDLVVVRQINLSVAPFALKGPLDIIFCRNVMIYFDNVVRQRLLGEMHRLLKPDGFLFVGHAESLTGMMSDFKIYRPAVYCK